MTATPRVDEAEKIGGNRFVANVARQLERELAKTRAKLEAAMDDVKDQATTIGNISAKLRETRAKLEAAERGAARYRWLRNEAMYFGYDTNQNSPWCVLGTSGYSCAPVGGDELDAAIDAAISDPSSGSRS